MTAQSPNAGLVDADGLDAIEALVADATAVEGVAAVHEGSGYFAERVIRRAVEQGTLVVVGPPNHPAYSPTIAALAPPQADHALVEALKPFVSFAEQFVDAEGWNELGLTVKDERIVDWFGPSDFRAALAAHPSLRETSDA